jgi:hypothetical protein
MTCATYILKSGWTLLREKAGSFMVVLVSSGVLNREFGIASVVEDAVVVYVGVTIRW